jgi:hypothetical protein
MELKSISALNFHSVGCVPAVLDCVEPVAASGDKRMKTRPIRGGFLVIGSADIAISLRSRNILAEPPGAASVRAS